MVVVTLRSDALESSSAKTTPSVLLLGGEGKKSVAIAFLDDLLLFRRLFKSACVRMGQLALPCLEGDTVWFRSI